MPEQGSYSTDAPVSLSEEDRFGRWSFAARIARLIAQRSDATSIVLSVNGAWGDGKTTVLNFIEQNLKSNPKVVILRFNPWRFPDEPTLVKDFMLSLAAQVDRNVKTKKEQIGDWIKKYQAPAGWVGKLFPSSIGKLVEATVLLGGLLSSAGLDELRRRVETALSESGKRVVVFVDDIDRLDKNEIQAVFRLVKLFADFKHTAYVLAFDAERVAEALQERFGNKEEAARSFLEKIVQVPLTLPDIPRHSLRMFLMQTVERAFEDAEIQLSEEELQRFGATFMKHLEIRLSNPRFAKRYGNALTFALPMLKGEANMVDLALIEGVRIFYPRVYNAIRDAPETVLPGVSLRMDIEQGRQQSVRQVIEKATEDLSEEERKAAIGLVCELFPVTAGALAGTRQGPGNEEIWTAAKRICSHSYFQRYFSYSVPQDDLSDIEVSEFLSRVQHDSMEQIQDSLEKLLNTNTAEAFLDKITRDLKPLSGLASVNLLRAIAKFAQMFTQFTNPFFPSPHARCVILCINLADRIPAEIERAEAIERLLKEVSDIDFVIDLFLWLPYEDDPESPKRTPQLDDDAPRKYAVTHRDRFKVAVGERIRCLAAEENAESVRRMPPGLWVAARKGTTLGDQ